jgi:hypothetical protein
LCMTGHGQGCMLFIVACVAYPPDKTFIRLCFECPAVSALHNTLINKYFRNTLPLTKREKQRLWFLGIHGDERNIFLTLCIFAFILLIRQMKLKN